MDRTEFLLREYDYYAEAFRQSEELGEKRVSSFLTFAAVVAAGLGVAIGDGGLGTTGALAAVAIAALCVLLLGQVTLARVIKRDLTSDDYKRAMGRLREWFVLADPSVEPYLHHKPKDAPPQRSVRLLDGRGSWAETMVWANGLLAGATVAAATAATVTQLDLPDWQRSSSAGAAGVAATIVALLVNARRANARYKPGPRA